MRIPVWNQLWSEQEAPMQPCGDSQHKAANAKLKRLVVYLLPNLLCHGGSNEGHLKLHVRTVLNKNP